MDRTLELLDSGHLDNWSSAIELGVSAYDLNELYALGVVERKKEKKKLGVEVYNFRKKRDFASIANYIRQITRERDAALEAINLIYTIAQDAANDA